MKNNEIMTENETSFIQINKKPSKDLNRNKNTKGKIKNTCIFFAVLSYIAIGTILVLIIKKLNDQKLYLNRMNEYIRNLNKGYFDRPSLAKEYNQFNNNDNQKLFFNISFNGSRNNYDETVINYSNISTGYNKLYKSSFKYEEFQSDLVDELHLKSFNEIEMRGIEQKFINGLIRYFKPKKLLEIGVSKGGTSAVILNAIQNIEGAFLYSIDFRKTTKRFVNKKEKFKNKPTGFLIDEKYQNLKEKWKLFTGDIPCTFIEEIGNNIDFVLIDTVHIVPGEFINFLEIFPFLKKNAIVLLHDISYIGNVGWEMSSNDRLFSILKGTKIILMPESGSIVENIGAVILDEDINERIFDVFFGIHTNWQYVPPKKETNKLLKHFRKYYKEKYTDFFLEAIKKNEKRISELKKNQYYMDYIKDIKNKIGLFEFYYE